MLRVIILIFFLTFTTSCAIIELTPKDITLQTMIKTERSMTKFEKEYFKNCRDTIIEIKKGPLHYIVVFCGDVIKFLPAINKAGR